MGGEDHTPQQQQQQQHQFAMEEHYFNHNQQQQQAFPSDADHVHTRSVSEEDFVMIDNSPPPPPAAPTTETATAEIPFPPSAIATQSVELNSPSFSMPNQSHLTDAIADTVATPLEKTGPTKDEGQEEEIPPSIPVAAPLEESEFPENEETKLITEQTTTTSPIPISRSPQELPAQHFEQQIEESVAEHLIEELIEEQEEEIIAEQEQTPPAQPVVEISESQKQHHDDSLVEPPSSSPESPPSDEKQQQHEEEERVEEQERPSSPLRCFFNTVINPASPSFNLVLNTGFIAWIGIVTLAFRCVVFGCEHNPIC